MVKEETCETCPVSVLVEREVLPGNEEEFEKSLKGIIEASSKFKGYLGTNVHSDPDAREYRVIFRFDTLKNLHLWENSQERKHWVEKIDRLIKSPTQLNYITGLETWFALPKAKMIVPPPRYKMAIVIWMAITPLLIAFNGLLGPWLSKLSLVPRVLVSTPCIVMIMTYVLMPQMTKLFAKWIYPSEN